MDPGHEERDVQLRFVLLGAAVLLALGLVSLGVVQASYRHLAPRPRPPPQTAAAAAEAERAFLGELAELRAAEETRLGSYGWVDRRAGIIRVPIERAIDLLLAPPPSPPSAGEAP